METRITGVKVTAFSIPTQSGPEADGTLAWKKTDVVIPEIRAGGLVGIGYSYADRAAAQVIRETLAGGILGKDAFDIPASHAGMIRKVRNLGRPGVASYAIAALDIALWDLKAKLLGVSLAKLLGQFRGSVAVYGSGGFTSYPIRKLQEQLSRWVDEGISNVKMKIGPDFPGFGDTLERVRAARMAIGIEPGLFVDANGAYEPKQALQLARRLAEFGVSWFEEPVSSDNLEGLAFIREHAPSEMEIAAGEYGDDAFYFDRMTQARAVDVIQIDATRCLGVTGFLAAAQLCATRHLSISAHTAPLIHSHLCCAIPHARHVEYFFDHVRIESMLFDGALLHSGGRITPDPGRPGLGVELKRQDLEQFAA